MKFIVYNSKVGGYFVSYKDKGSDYFSSKWFEAKKYNTILPALNRLGIILNKSMKSLEDFYKENPLDKSVNRNELLAEILGSESESILVFIDGYIEAVDGEGNRHSAKKYILDYVNNYIESNCRRIERYNKGFAQSNYINNQISDDDFFGL